MWPAICQNVVNYILEANYMNEQDRKLLECINLNLNSIVVNQALLFTKLDKLCAELAKENSLKK